jgi:hypothetical protein
VPLLPARVREWQIGCRVYKPRRPRDSPLYRLVERHLEELLRVWPERFARRHGPLRGVVERVLRSSCVAVSSKHGFARLWCGECRRSVLAPSPAAGGASAPPAKRRSSSSGPSGCATRCWPKSLTATNHLVLTIPRLLRPLFRRRRELLTELARAGAEAVSELVRLAAGGEARPGIVVSVATAGDLLQWHPTCT